MKKQLVRGVLVASALMMLGGTAYQPATAKHINGRGGHRGGHHCGVHPGEKHPKSFYRKKADARDTSIGHQRRLHRHHHHRCKLYPPA